MTEVITRTRGHCSKFSLCDYAKFFDNFELRSANRLLKEKMTNEAEQNYIQELVAYSEETLDLLSNQEKTKRERMVGAAFLREESGSGLDMGQSLLDDA